LVTLAAVPLAAVVLDFDPILRLGGIAVRTDALVAAGGVLLALIVAAILAWREPEEIRPEDLLFIALAAAPGAVIGGRLGYVLVHLDYYRANPAAILDPSQGSLELTLAVAGAALTAGYAARILSGLAGPWFRLAAMPTLIVVGVGKVAMALGGRGQGQPASEPWATYYTGPGPWGSLAPGTPSHPAQLYEAGAIAVILLFVAALLSIRLFRGRDGLVWIVAIALWLAARTAIAATWRDAPVVGPLGAEQLLSLAVLAVCVSIGSVLARAPGSPARQTRGEVRWPDAETRPPF
jgi:phosphatidylglycerol---prolipoprotein diacylglyceryl transferase